MRTGSQSKEVGYGWMMSDVTDVPTVNPEEPRAQRTTVCKRTSMHQLELNWMQVFAEMVWS